MASEFRLPELGENIEKGELLKLLVGVGDTISKDQPVLELETDKATIEVPSSVIGRVKDIHVKAGESVKVGQLILTVEDGSEAKAGSKRQAAPQAPEREKPAAPQAAETQGATPAGAARETQSNPRREAQSKPDRQAESAAETRLQPFGSKPAPSSEPEEPSSQEPESRANRPVPAEDSAAPASPRAEVVDISRARPAAAAEPEHPKQIAPAAPSVRREARELGLDINQIPGSGPGGRISAEDVTEYARGVITSIAGSKARSASAPLPDFAKFGPVERQPMSNVRRKTAEHMAEAWGTVPQVTQFDRADITSLEELRKRYAKKAEAIGGKLTVTGIAVKVIVSALRVFPQFAASLDMTKNEIIYRRYAHIGVAVDTDRGLLVPVIRDADRKNILEISRELAELADKARNKKLAPEEMQGGVFTITNLGGIGGTNFSPIVNYPEVAILGLSRASVEPVFLNGQIAPRLILPLSLSYDHRLIDGANAARFLRWVAEALEQPFLLPLQG